MDCPRCAELQGELARVIQLATDAGLYAPPPPTNNYGYDTNLIEATWMAQHPRSTPTQAWLGGWFQAWAIANRLLSDCRARVNNQSGEISSLRSRIGALLLEFSRRYDNGGG